MTGFYSFQPTTALDVYGATIGNGGNNIFSDTLTYFDLVEFDGYVYSISSTSVVLRGVVTIEASGIGRYVFNTTLTITSTRMRLSFIAHNAILGGANPNSNAINPRVVMFRGNADKVLNGANPWDDLQLGESV